MRPTANHLNMFINLNFFSRAKKTYGPKKGEKKGEDKIKG